MDINQNSFQLFDQKPSDDDLYAEVWCGQLKFAVDLSILIKYSDFIKEISNKTKSLPKGKQSNAFINNFSEVFNEISESLKISQVNLQFFLCLLTGRRITLYSNDLFDYYKLSKYFQIPSLMNHIQNYCESQNNINDIFSIIASRKISEEEEENFNDFIECGNMKDKLSNEIRKCLQNKNFRNNLPLSSIFIIFQSCKSIHIKSKERNHEETIESLKSENEKLKQTIESIQAENAILKKNVGNEKLNLKPELKKINNQSKQAPSTKFNPKRKSFLNQKTKQVNNASYLKKAKINNQSKKDAKSSKEKSEDENVDTSSQKGQNELNKEKSEDNVEIDTENFEDDFDKEKNDNQDLGLSTDNFEDESSKEKSDNESKKEKNSSDSDKDKSDKDSSKDKSSSDSDNDKSDKDSSKDKSSSDSDKEKNDHESSKKISDDDFIDDNFEDGSYKEKNDSGTNKENFEDDSESKKSEDDKKSDNESNQDFIDFSDDFE